jgi:3-oxoacyl-[acyl-carrier protein] reductase
VLIDAWVLKRWDLKGHITKYGMERIVLDLVINGLLGGTEGECKYPRGIASIEGKSVLLLGDGGPLVDALASYLSLNGAVVSAYFGGSVGNRSGNFLLNGKGSSTYRIYDLQGYGPLNRKLLSSIMSEQGPVDFVVHDLSFCMLPKATEASGFNTEKLNLNLYLTYNLSDILADNLGRRASGRIVYIAPSAWEKNVDPVLYETTRAGATALTTTMAEKLAKSKINVNCIVPGLIAELRPTDIETQELLRLTESVPFGQLGDVRDITDTLLFLLTGPSKYITGQVLTVGGGI